MVGRCVPVLGIRMQWPLVWLRPRDASGAALSDNAFGLTAYGKFAVGAYNINNMEQALGLFEGHAKAQAPFIVQLSKGEIGRAHV